MLSSQSSLLKDIFLSTPIYEEKTVVILPEAKTEELHQLVSFLYGRTQEIKLPPHIFLRLGLVGGKKANQSSVLNDLNSNMMDNLGSNTDQVSNEESFHFSDSHKLFVKNYDHLEHLHLLSHPLSDLCDERVLDKAGLEEHELGPANIEDSLNNQGKLSIVFILKLTATLLVNPLIGLNQILQEVNPDLQFHEVQFVPKEVKEFGVVLKCQYCVESFNSMFDLENHIIEEHKTEDGKYLPPPSGTGLDTDGDGYQQFLPVLCGDLQYQSSVGEEEVPQNGLFSCAFCNINFDLPRELGQHVHHNHPVDRLDSNRVFCCNLCPDLGYHSLTDFEAHISLQHRKAAPSYQCPDCSKDFKFSRFLRNHIRTHISEKAFQCGRCKTILSTEGSLRVHVRKCSKGRFSNDDTGNTPRSKADVKARTKKYTCIGCQKMFTNRIRAEIHVAECRKLQVIENELSTCQDNVGSPDVAAAVHKDINDEPTKESDVDIDGSIQTNDVRGKKFDEVNPEKMHRSDDIDMNVATNTMRSRSGRIIKFKRPFDDLTTPKRKRRRTMISDLAPFASKSNSVRTSLQCPNCEFYDEGKTGWGQNCQEPLPVTQAEPQGPPSDSPTPSDSGEENHNQKVKTDVEEEEECCSIDDQEVIARFVFS